MGHPSHDNLQSTSQKLLEIETSGKLQMKERVLSFYMYQDMVDNNRPRTLENLKANIF